jgi:hypothetical protein
MTQRSLNALTAKYFREVKVQSKVWLAVDFNSFRVFDVALPQGYDSCMKVPDFKIFQYLFTRSLRIKNKIHFSTGFTSRLTQVTCLKCE